MMRRNATHRLGLVLRGEGTELARIETPIEPHRVKAGRRFGAGANRGGPTAPGSARWVRSGDFLPRQGPVIWPPGFWTSGQGNVVLGKKPATLPEASQETAGACARQCP
jgi:hypothetical protein